MPKLSQSAQKADAFFNERVLPLFSDIDQMTRNELKALVTRLSRSYGTANHGVDSAECLTLDEADVSLALASLAQSKIDGDTLSRSEVAAICNGMKKKR